MREYFFNNLGKRHVLVLYGLGGAGKSQTAFKFIDACQVENQDPRYTIKFPYSHWTYARVKVLGRLLR